MQSSGIYFNNQNNLEVDINGTIISTEEGYEDGGAGSMIYDNLQAQFANNSGVSDNVANEMMMSYFASAAAQMSNG